MKHFFEYISELFTKTSDISYIDIIILWVVIFALFIIGAAIFFGIGKFLIRAEAKRRYSTKIRKHSQNEIA